MESTTIYVVTFFILLSLCTDHDFVSSFKKIDCDQKLDMLPVKLNSLA